MPAQRRRVLLTTTHFRGALSKYMDENKATLDPLMKQQLECSTFEWENDSEQQQQDGGENDRVEPNLSSDSDRVKKDPVTSSANDGDHILAGTLSWTGEYAQVQLHIETSWNDRVVRASEASDPCTSLSTLCRVASCRLLGSKKKNEDGTKVDKVEQKIRSRVISRLKQDDYIRKLLTPEEDESKGDATSGSNDDKVLFEARVLLGEGQQSTAMEERVDTRATTAEAVRRAVWSSSSADDGALDLFDLLLNLPWLPCQHQQSHKDQSIVTPLADRARLRLLEDAMCEACEQQGDEELLSDLVLDGAKRQKS